VLIVARKAMTITNMPKANKDEDKDNNDDSCNIHSFSNVMS
jgi:hypothetical protein